MHEEPNIEDLVFRWHEALGRKETPSAGKICVDCPEMSAVLEQELIAREFARIGIIEVGVAGRGPGPGIPEALVADAEPVPGYRLVRRIGRGGSGDVWEASGPGGISVAIKFVDIAEGPEAPPTVRQRRLDSLRSLELVRGVRHPNLLPMFGAWSRDGLLIFVMELAERTLQDHLDEVIREGASGIPRPELIAYMEQAAAGVDFLNEAHHAGGGRKDMGVQHGDIKPQNLFLVGGCVKVGDFGQAIRPGDFDRRSCGMTASYAPPELSQGIMSGRSDQYALAVTYCQLRGGRLPFLGTSLEVLMGHFREAPDLTMLPKDERPAVARALAKRPAERWADCRTFVDAIARPRAARGRRGLDSRDFPAPPTARLRPILFPIGLLALAALAALIATFAATGRSREPGPTRVANALEGRETPRENVATAGPGPVDAPVVIPPLLNESADPASATLEPEISLTGGGGEPSRKTELAAAGEAPTSPSRESPVPSEGDRDVVANPPPEPKTPESAHEPEKPRPTADSKQAASGEVASLVTPDQATRGAEGAVIARPPENRPTIEVPPKAEAGRIPATPRVARAASITILMPSAKAELAVKGEVGRGTPDEWYGPTRVIHSPPMGRGADYIVGAFWMDAAGRPQARSCRIRVEPGKVYEVNLRPSIPTSKELVKADPPGDLSPGRIR